MRSTPGEVPRCTCTCPVRDRRSPMSEAGRVSVVIVDDHAMFPAGSRGARRRGRGARGGRRRRRGDRRHCCAHPGGRPARRAPARRRVEVMRRMAASPATGSPHLRYLALSVSDAAEDVIGTIRGGARGTSPRRSGPGQSGPSSGWRTATRCSPAPGGLRRGVRRHDRRRGGRRGPRPTHRTGAVMQWRARLRLQGGRQRAVHLDQDRRDPHVERAARKLQLVTARAEPLGVGPSAA